ncbi:hypothetical protein [Tropicimonas sp. S265A]|uniref:hypothetical protein n=1 Tax=Tropicimonas sp. S265A TaxID=3415134 RepID=UPI003C7DED68
MPFACWGLTGAWGRENGFNRRAPETAAQVLTFDDDRLRPHVRVALQEHNVLQIIEVYSVSERLRGIFYCRRGDGVK